MWSIYIISVCGCLRFAMAENAPSDRYLEHFYTLRDNMKQQQRSRLEQTLPCRRGSRKRSLRHGGGGDYCTCESDGTTQLQTLTRLLDRLGGTKYVRTSVQKDIHAGMVAAVLHRLFMNESETAMRAAMSTYMIEASKPQFMVLAGRRVGKTIATSLFVAAYLLSVPGCKICVFSTGKRASNLFLQEVKSMLSVEQVFVDLIATDNSEHLELNVNGDLRKISSFPGNARTLRGVGGDLLILEEAAHIKSDVFYEVIVPLMGLKHTSVLAISTPGTSDNWYSGLLERRNSRNELIFSCYTARATCIRCRLAGLDHTCDHVPAEIAPWKSKGKREVTDALYADNHALALRELSGIIADDVNAAYSRLLVEANFNRPRYRQPDATVNRPPVIFVAIDPCGGGASQFAMASVFLLQRKRLNSALSGFEFVLCGLENQVARGHADVSRIVLSHIRALRCMFPFPGTEICVGVESNLGMEASNIAHMLRHESGLVCMSETRSRDGVYGPGFTTTNARKVHYYEILQTALVRNTFHLSDSIVSTDACVCTNTLKEQMLAYKRIVSTPATAFSIERQTFSGKVDGTGRMAPERLCDDLLLATQMALFISLLVIDGKSVSRPPGSYSCMFLYD